MAQQQLPEIFAFMIIRHVRLSLWAPYVPSVIPQDQVDTSEADSEESFPMEIVFDGFVCTRTRLDIG